MSPDVMIGAGVLAVLALLWAAVEARTARSRWGVVREKLRQGGAGAFRSAAVTEERARSVPGSVRVAGPLGMIVGLTAPLVCVPVVLDLMYREFTDPYGRPSPGLWFAVLTTVLLAGQCLFLVRSAQKVLRCERGAGDTAVLTGQVGFSIQLLSLAGLLLAGAFSSPVLPLALLLSTLLIVANVALLRAGAVVTEVQSHMTHDEWYALPGERD